jgi:hypothetical protein
MTVVCLKTRFSLVKMWFVALLHLLACQRQAQLVKVSDREPELRYLLWDFSCAVLLHSSAAKVWGG